MTMAKNLLLLNSDKTHLIIMATQHQHRLNGDFGIALDTGTDVNVSRFCEKMLGGYIFNNLKWKEHVMGNKKSLFRTLKSKINALSKK